MGGTVKISNKKLELYTAEKVWGIQELSENSGISKRTYSRLGKSESKPKIVRKLAKALGISVADILED